jgi:5-methylcytosine-specific restriction endonuclease McrA
MTGDPRWSSAYQRKRRAFIADHPPGSPCCHCGDEVDTTLSGNHPWGPTVEHTVPVRNRPDLALDISLWQLSHRKCNDRQGGRSTRERDDSEHDEDLVTWETYPTVTYEPSRDW